MRSAPSIALLDTSTTFTPSTESWGKTVTQEGLGVRGWNKKYEELVLYHAFCCFNGARQH